MCPEDIDTQYLGALADGDDAARANAAELERQQVATRVPTAVIWEAYAGIGNAGSEETAQQLRGLYDKLVTSRSAIDLSPGVSRRAGELNGRHLQSDSLAVLDEADSIVAAHGLILDEPAVSNGSDFRDVDGLEVVTY